MLIDEQYRKMVTALYVDRHVENGEKPSRIPVATTFFVLFETNKDLFFIYLVTAAHCINESRMDGMLWARINTTDGKYQDVKVPQDGWVLHPKTDIAICSTFQLPSSADIKALPYEHLATNDWVKTRGVGLGDDVFFATLFQRFPGKQRIQPIIRFGNISSMPYELIPLKLDSAPNADPMDIEAYLVETRSWGGSSGAPTFIHFPIYREPGVVTLPEWPLKDPLVHLLGIVHGHFDISQQIALSGDVLGKGLVNINSGIAVIIPAQYIHDMLMWEEFVEEREQAKANSRISPRSDSDTYGQTN